MSKDYPRIVVVMNKEIHKKFIKKCKKEKLRKSQAFNMLAKAWVNPKIIIKNEPFNEEEF